MSYIVSDGRGGLDLDVSGRTEERFLAKDDKARLGSVSLVVDTGLQDEERPEN